MYSNVMISIGGGSTSLVTSSSPPIYGLLTNPDQLADVKAIANAVDEGRSKSPRAGCHPSACSSAMSPALSSWAGCDLRPGDKITAVIASANRDELVYDDPDVFDIHRKGPHHLAFGGGGPHYCIGAWVSRSSVSTVTLPALFDRLPNVRLDPEAGDVTWGGVVFRGPLSMHVRWDA